MKIRPLFLTLSILLICLIPQNSHPCTTFCLDKGEQLVVGNNMDWMIGDGLVVVNKRNVSKTAMLLPEWREGQPASWTSKYGSVTFNFVGREFPFGGMNEAGLVITCMWLETTEYPDLDSRPSISVEQWKQYQLDNFCTVQEVLASDSQIRIATKSLAKIHFLVSDRMGNCAIIEFLGGKMIYYTKETMPANALANITYKESVDFWQEGKLPTSNMWNSAQRFATAADMMKKYNVKTSKLTADYAFDILTNVSQEVVEEIIDGVPIRSAVVTEWSIVYDIKNLRVYFHTFDNKKNRYIDLNSLDFSCKTPVKVLDILEDLFGDVSNKFVNYTYKINRELVGKTKYLPDNFFRTDNFLDDIAKYPDTTVCAE